MRGGDGRRIGAGMGGGTGMDRDLRSGGGGGGGGGGGDAGSKSRLPSASWRSGESLMMRSHHSRFLCSSSFHRPRRWDWEAAGGGVGAEVYFRTRSVHFWNTTSEMWSFQSTAFKNAISFTLISCGMPTGRTMS